MQRPGTETIKIQIQPSNHSWKQLRIQIIKTQRTYGQPSEQLVPERWPLSNPNRTKNNKNIHKCCAKTSLLVDPCNAGKVSFIMFGRLGFCPKTSWWLLYPFHICSEFLAMFAQAVIDPFTAPCA